MPSRITFTVEELGLISQFLLTGKVKRIIFNRKKLVVYLSRNKSVVIEEQRNDDTVIEEDGTLNVPPNPND